MTPAELKEDINEKERLMKKRIAGVLTRYSSERREVLEELMLREIECVEDKYRQEKKELLAELTARRAAWLCVYSFCIIILLRNPDKKMEIQIH